VRRRGALPRQRGGDCTRYRHDEDGTSGRRQLQRFGTLNGREEDEMEGGVAAEENAGQLGEAGEESATSC
jgi:hypothetical protein